MMKEMNNSHFKEYAMPSIILVLICVVVTFALVTTFMVTEPIIKIAAEREAEEARKKVLPESTGFELLISSEMNEAKLTDNALEVYKTNNNVGYAVLTQDKGYGGTIKVITGIGEDGTIKNVILLEQKETPGLGTRAGEAAFVGQFTGKETVEVIDTISGATISSNAMIRAVGSALQQMEAIKKGGI